MAEFPKLKHCSTEGPAMYEDNGHCKRFYYINYIDYIITSQEIPKSQALLFFLKKLAYAAYIRMSPIDRTRNFQRVKFAMGFR